MRRSALLALALAGCATSRPDFRQAGAVTPAPAPSFPHPGFTPAGAGASHGSLATPQRPVERSPNRRILPPSDKPGFWAADPVKAFKADDPPDDGDDPGEEPVGDGPTATNECREDIRRATEIAHVADRLKRLPDPQRECVLARLLLVCSNAELKPLVRFPEHVSRIGRWVHNDVPAINVRAGRHARAACRGVSLSLEALTVYNGAVERFDAATNLPRLK